MTLLRSAMFKRRGADSFIGISSAADFPKIACVLAVWPEVLCLGIRYFESVRLVIARCSVDYAGRLSAHLPLATRLLLVKADGSVLVHSDSRSYKPLNWMSCA